MRHGNGIKWMGGTKGIWKPFTLQSASKEFSDSASSNNKFSHRGKKRSSTGGRFHCGIRWAAAGRKISPAHSLNDSTQLQSAHAGHFKLNLFDLIRVKKMMAAVLSRKRPRIFYVPFVRAVPMTTAWQKPMKIKERGGGIIKFKLPNVSQSFCVKKKTTEWKRKWHFKPHRHHRRGDNHRGPHNFSRIIDVSPSVTRSRWMDINESRSFLELPKFKFLARNTSAKRRNENGRRTKDVRKSFLLSASGETFFVQPLWRAPWKSVVTCCVFIGTFPVLVWQ